MQEARDPEVGVLIIDMVMGTNTLEDPASVYVPPIKSAIVTAKSEGRNLAVIIHICASEDDEKNNLRTQEQQFSDAGCLVFKTNEETAFMAAAILSNSSVN
jgi:FdrA protein